MSVGFKDPCSFHYAARLKCHDWGSVYSGCRMEASLGQRKSENGDINKEAVEIVQSRLKL